MCNFDINKKPHIEFASGNKHWYLDGKLHRTDGPAVEYANGNKRWYLNDNRHRLDGPAVEYANGNKHWYLNDIEYSFSEWLNKTNYTEQEKTLARMKRTYND